MRLVKEVRKEGKKHNLITLVSLKNWAWKKK